MIKVDVISGFLGAGKTTLIKTMYAHAFKTEKVVLIENEFGKVGIDGAFLKEAGIEIKEINSGCICCTLVGDFNKSLQEVIDRYHPDRLIIEPSGVGKLSDIIDSIHKFGDSLELNIVATVVDCGKCKMYLKNFGEFYIDQVKQANTIVVSKVDLATEDKLHDTVETLRSLNDKANIVTTGVDQLDSAKLLETLEQDKSMMQALLDEVMEAAKHHHHHHHHHDGEECDDPDCECHHHHDEDEDEEHEHHHHHDEDDDEEHEHHHHHDEDDDDDEEHEHHHHHHDDDEECDDPDCECHHHHDEDEDEEHEHHHHHHGHDADDVFESWGVETVRSYTHDELDGILRALCGEGLGVILRSKGIVKASDNDSWYYFDLVAGDYEIRLGAPDYTGRLCVIGSGIDKSKIKELFGV
jgi:G3E family GTPase